MSLVDPWKIQAQLMKISGQHIPDAPTVHNGSILYAALIAEEVAETFIALARAMEQHSDEPATEDLCTYSISMSFAALGAILQGESIKIRKRLKDVTINFPLLPAEAVEILDGTTDVAVVNSGFALASGLPGAEAYENVAKSNYSKANPETGKIDKDESGKWIKGPNFFVPNLMSLLEQHYGVPAK